MNVEFFYATFFMLLFYDPYDCACKRNIDFDVNSLSNGRRKEKCVRCSYPLTSIDSSFE